MKLKPLADRVVLKQLEAEETTKSGIVLPGKEKEKPQQAEVIAVGPGKLEDGKTMSENQKETMRQLMKGMLDRLMPLFSESFL